MACRVYSLHGNRSIIFYVTEISTKRKVSEISEVERSRNVGPKLAVRNTTEAESSTSLLSVPTVPDLRFASDQL